MVFSSLLFLFIFLPVVLILYYLLPFQGKNIVLLLASILFYAWGEPVYVVLMVLNIAFNYMAGRILEGTRNGAARRLQLVFALIVNLGLLGFFKYAGFVAGILDAVLPWNVSFPDLALPIGISFYTFQALSYVIDVYRRKCGAQKNILNFALYITMFPQLVAGPIVKYTQIEEQLANRKISRIKSSQGLERLIFGLSKKVILANNLGLLYTAIQGSDRSILTAWLGAIAYTLQIYFDFSGYSDMAIGMGKMLGFDFPENFDHPYIAGSITDFWRRWHMTLSGWFRDYVYIPLGGNRVSVPRHIINLLIVWMLTGLWHGAGWNFILWGLYYGVLLIIEKYLLGPLLKNAPVIVRHIYTLFLVVLGWVIFSNTDFDGMHSYLGNMFGIGATGFADKAFFYYLKSNLLFLVLGILASTPAFRKYLNARSGKRPVVMMVGTVILILVDIAFLVAGTYNPFLYFRF